MQRKGFRFGRHLCRPGFFLEIRNDPALSLFQFFLVHTLIQKPGMHLIHGISRLMKSYNLLLGSVDPVIIRICMTVKSIYRKDDDRRFSGIPDPLHNLFHRFIEVLGIPSVHTDNGDSIEFFRIPSGWRKRFFLLFWSKWRNCCPE